MTPSEEDPRRIAADDELKALRHFVEFALRHTVPFRARELTYEETYSILANHPAVTGKAAALSASPPGDGGEEKKPEFDWAAPDPLVEDNAAVMHTAFRHVGSSEDAGRAYRAIAEMDNKEWLEIVRYATCWLRKRIWELSR